MWCSRRLYNLGETVLYQRLVQPTSRALPLFIKTILAHPHLAKLVRAVHLTDQGPSDLPFQPPREIFTDARRSLRGATSGDFDRGEIEKIEAKIKSLPGSAPSWLQDVRDKSWDAIAALTLALLPNLEVLDIDQCQTKRWQFTNYHRILLWPHPSSHIRNLFSYAAPSILILKAKFRSLSISYEHRSDSLLGLCAIPPLVLLYLQSLSGDMMREGFWQPPLYQKNFPLKSLWLERSNFSTRSLCYLINACPHLETLKYEHDEEYGDAFSETHDYPFFPRQLDGALASLEGCLKKLILYRIAQNPRPGATRSDFGIIKSLKHFKQLTHLSITAQLLLGPQMIDGSDWYEESLLHSAEAQSLDSCLPPSLKHLELKKCGENIYDQVKGLFEVKQLRVPNLKSLVINIG